jgi:hypothetical protein
MALTKIVEAFSVSHAQVLNGSQTWMDAVVAAAAASDDIYGVNEASLDVDDDDFDNEGDDSVLSTWAWFNYADVSVQAGYLSFDLLANITGRPVEVIAAGAAVNEVQTLTAFVGATGGTFKLSYAGQQTAAIAYNAAAAAIQTALEALVNVGVGDIVVTGTNPSTTPIVFTFANDKAATAQPTIVIDKTAVTGLTSGGVLTETTSGHAATGSATAIDLWHEDSMNVAPKPMLVVMPSKDNLGQPCRLLIGLYRVSFRPMSLDGPAYKDGLKVNLNGRAVMSPVDELGNTFADGKKRCGKILSTILG